MLDIISKDVCTYMKQHHIRFSDFEQAAIIYNSVLDVNSKHKSLKAIADKTDDTTLKEQISERLKLDSEYIERIKNISENFIFTVELDFDVVTGHFSDWETAYKFGVKLNREFYIKKYMLIGSKASSEESETNKSFLYPELPQAGLTYDQYGNLRKFWSSESEAEINSRDDLSTRFENGFINVPNPFERGDIVKLVGVGTHGIVATSQEEWKTFLKKVASKKPGWVDFTDVGITIDFIDDDRQIRHRHINPIYLERHKPQGSDEDYGLLMIGSALCSGKLSLDMFIGCYNKYRNNL